jgi:hypothetical protein
VHKGTAEQASAVVAEKEQLQVEAATARDDLAAEAAAKAELEARVAALEADLAATLTWLEVGADMKSRNDIAAIFIILYSINRIAQKAILIHMPCNTLFCTLCRFLTMPVNQRPSHYYGDSSVNVQL